MKLREWLKEMEYELLQGNLDEEVDDVVYDSRKAAAGSVFVCMRGANVDSHKFIPDVIQNGGSGHSPRRNYSTQGRERQKCPVPAFGCPLWLSCQKNDDDRRNRNKGENDDNLYDKGDPGSGR